MEKILIVIAICEVVRALQNGIQLMLVLRDTAARDNAYAEFIKSLKSSDKEFAEKLLQEYKEQEDADAAD